MTSAHNVGTLIRRPLGGAIDLPWNQSLTQLTNSRVTNDSITVCSFSRSKIGIIIPTIEVILSPALNYVQ